ncbi:hypothetical protein C1Y40_05505 [Mycobacterium talmoniae]|uniref:HTH tetR-type domain-containing protein n=1 Tax=Mycobacterium talmoniae TaxID=1858794 RepID=A0A2S8BCF7_9MYCO|nr:hypothetical protein C1Y40_05505 [Mycobacterium talmoniae]
MFVSDAEDPPHQHRSRSGGPSGYGSGACDARRNRERLIEAAVAAFSGGQDTVALEAIARDAGVGIGTLYRNFPSREALVEAVYRSELARLCDGAGDLVATLAPDRALRHLDGAATWSSWRPSAGWPRRCAR